MQNNTFEILRASLLSEGITEPEEFWESRVIDIYQALNADKDLILKSFKKIADKLELPTGNLLSKNCEPHLFFDIYADYYNDNNIRVDMALINNGYKSLSLAEIKVVELFGIRGICSDNMETFLSKIYAAHCDEYGC